jgi:hypothetical protein
MASDGSDFGYENNYDPDMSHFDRYSIVGPFSFERSGYIKVLEAAGAVARES